MSAVLLLTDHGRTPQEVLPALGELPHAVRVLPASAAWTDPTCDVVLVDARKDLQRARSVCHSLKGGPPLLAVFTDGGLITLDSGWGVDDILLDSSPAAEVAVRLQMAGTRRPLLQRPAVRRMPSGLSFDDSARTVRLNDRAIPLTHAEYQILTRLAARPGQILTYRQLLESYNSRRPQSTRTIHTHVRRLRAKLGPDHAALIHTSHGLGYRLRSVNA
ncbi:winged helix-turn-helix domain-containing protein [Actinomadura barringtoniae]|uniref:Winged helix-turn-helix domain-containing protein n=1 Tax=Actinomadura barringtoniae TaxID=1427535 RepID=A0A939T5X8_9ACTN|nr:winged helix-turn-helix domain-containing protein [Actinomadura barringtoniae]MBO2451178.1 winged helix-turn-helix domain-containing protein [Actinomadura barringtoniae]